MESAMMGPDNVNVEEDDPPGRGYVNGIQRMHASVARAWQTQLRNLHVEIKQEQKELRHFLGRNGESSRAGTLRFVQMSCPYRSRLGPLPGLTHSILECKVTGPSGYCFCCDFCC